MAAGILGVLSILKDLDSFLSDQAKLAYMAVKWAKNQAKSLAGTDDPDEIWSATIAYERAAGQLDMLETLCLHLLGDADGSKLLREAATAVGYERYKMNDVSVHAAAMLADPPQKQTGGTYSGGSYQTSQASRSTGGSGVVTTATQADIEKARAEQAAKIAAAGGKTTSAPSPGGVVINLPEADHEKSVLSVVDVFNPGFCVGACLRASCVGCRHNNKFTPLLEEAFALSSGSSR